MSKLGKIQKYIDKGKEAALVSLAQPEEEKEVRLAALAGLQQIGKDDSFNTFISMMNDPDPDIRVICIEGLGKIKNAHADAHLRHQLERENDERVKGALKAAIDALRG